LTFVLVFVVVVVVVAGSDGGERMAAEAFGAQRAKDATR